MTDVIIMDSPEYAAGRKAYRDGLERDENPYREDRVKRLAWLMGFNWEREKDMADDYGMDAR